MRRALLSLAALSALSALSCVSAKGFDPLSGIKPSSQMTDEEVAALLPAALARLSPEEAQALQERVQARNGTVSAASGGVGPASGPCSPSWLFYDDSDFSVSGQANWLFACHRLFACHWLFACTGSCVPRIVFQASCVVNVRCQWV